jgi:hypothetical protein
MKKSLIHATPNDAFIQNMTVAPGAALSVLLKALVLLLALPLKAVMGCRRRCIAKLYRYMAFPVF